MIVPCFRSLKFQIENFISFSLSILKEREKLYHMSKVIHTRSYTDSDTTQRMRGHTYTTNSDE